MSENDEVELQYGDKILITSTPSGQNNGIWEVMIERLSRQELEEKINTCLYYKDDKSRYGVLKEVLWRVYHKEDHKLIIKGVLPHIKSSEYRNKITKKLLELS